MADILQLVLIVALCLSPPLLGSEALKDSNLPGSKLATSRL